MKRLFGASLFLALAATILPAQAADLPEVKITNTNQVPACATPGRLMAYLHIRNPKADARFESVATQYMTTQSQVAERQPLIRLLSFGFAVTLSRPISSRALTFGCPFMRLTTRLLDLASWLLIRRALKEGEISETEAQKKRSSVSLHGPAKPSHVQGYDSLPQGMRDLITESYALYDRIVRLDRAFCLKLEEVAAEPVLTNPVGAQMDRIRLAFSS